MAISCEPSDLLNSARCFESCGGDPMAIRNFLLLQFVPCVPAGSPPGTPPVVGCNAPAAPANLEVTPGPNNPGSTTIAIDWTQPVSNPPVTTNNYAIIWAVPRGPINFAVIPGTQLNYTITGLTPSTDYSIAVRAIHGACASSSSVLHATTTSTPPPFPQLANLVLKLESNDFDGTANGTALTIWTDHSGLGNNLDHVGVGLSGNPAQPTVDGVTLCNGHKTVRFDGTMGIGSPNQFITGVPTGAEMMIVFVNDADPPTGVPANANGAFFQLGTSNAATGSLNPFTDSNFYESFWTTTRPNIGNPATTTAGAFCCYNVSVKADNTAFNAWINSENFFTSGAYTFSVAGRSPTTIGCWFSGVTNLFGKGNVAAAYMWQVPLSAAERAQARAYITNLWGVVFP